MPLDHVLQVVARHYGVDQASFAVKHSKAASRDVAAWLARRVTTATLRELTAPFGLGHPDSVRNLIRRADLAMQQSAKFRREVNTIQQSLHKKDENRV
jgi:chromosomal replication initiation ATPase DnaA